MFLIIDKYNAPAPTVEHAVMANPVERGGASLWLRPLHNSWAAIVWPTAADVVALAFHGEQCGASDRPGIDAPSVPLNLP